ncbi:hypothetical protein BN134_3453 [Cronobacter dublinensis 1210]|uniref:Uncharacterized protein n=1 Tax=Cronobacter dublinensis 1210 TaxID=1208656 RepID=A0ABP1WDH0_9ENTR|nr:hypothetical protein BN134_3453 [Cronobacter dublinensis 1210]
MGMKTAPYTLLGIKHVINTFNTKWNVFLLFKRNQRTSGITMFL